MPYRRGSEPTIVDGIKFPSKLEANTYEVLKSYPIGSIMIASSGNPYKIIIKPKTETFAAETWSPDFFLNKHDVIIEAKGFFEREWLRKMKYLEFLQPEVFKKIVLVCVNCDRIPYKRAKVINLTQLDAFCRRLMNG